LNTTYCFTTSPALTLKAQPKGIHKPKRGYSRDHRPDCKQVNIALVDSRHGLPLSYEIFAGNRHDSTTVETIVKAMEKQYGKADRIWVMDRGMASEDNLEFLKEGGRRHILGTPKGLLKRFEQELTAKDWKQVHEDWRFACVRRQRARGF
jgi:transposase